MTNVLKGTKFYNSIVYTRHQNRAARMQKKMALSTLCLCLSLLLLVSCHVLEGKVTRFTGKRGVQQNDPPVLNDTVTLGCYLDKANDRVFSHVIKNYRKLQGLWNYYPKFTEIFEMCADAAKRRGYPYFGIEYYAECWSGKIGGEWRYSKHEKSKRCVGRVGTQDTIMVYKFKGCYEEGQYYADGAEMPKDDPCMESCRCSSGQKVCYMRQCPGVDTTLCMNTGKDSDNCCTICQCLHNGATMPEGAQWTAKQLSDGTCSRCTCTEGAAVCHLQLSGCTAPVTIPPETEPPTFSFPFQFP